MGGAGNGIRTRDFQLGKLTLYQLSYARKRRNINAWLFLCKEEENGYGLQVSGAGSIETRNLERETKHLDPYPSKPHPLRPDNTPF
jgi:hypothetical protein